MIQKANKMELGVTQTAVDHCTPTLVQRVAALLDRDPSLIKEGVLLPRGWHISLFTVSTPQSALRPDGVAGLGFAMPDIGLPRLMMGGRRTHFLRDIVIGSKVQRQTQIVSVSPKNGRSGRIAIVTVRHEISMGSDKDVSIVEEQDFIMRDEVSSSRQFEDKIQLHASSAPMMSSGASRDIKPTEAMLFRYSAITFNTHLIHYDYNYATKVEGYPSLVVNGGLSALLLIEFFKEQFGKEPETFNARNISPLYCGEIMRLRAFENEGAWRLWVENTKGQLSLDATVQ